ncbi:uncharacterized protein LOC109835048 [Asparagus officinalis]|uniref:uncharacterized protein LOC109835048 n=1 Tax=Asparagus officinalis TaxID=4686 RepID=UPI00098E04C3|nr:uncharacterized protein LOC109835048 [Asparagus officinalis]
MSASKTQRPFFPPPPNRNFQRLPTPQILNSYSSLHRLPLLTLSLLNLTLDPSPHSTPSPSTASTTKKQFRSSRSPGIQQNLLPRRIPSPALRPPLPFPLKIRVVVVVGHGELRLSLSSVLKEIGIITKTYNRWTSKAFFTRDDGKYSGFHLYLSGDENSLAGNMMGNIAGKIQSSSHFGDKTDKGLEEPRGSVFSDDRCTFANASLDQSSEGWLANCLSDIDTHRSSGEMSVQFL